MRVTVLGSGTLLPDTARHSAAHHVVGSGTSVLLDCGSGTLHGFDRSGIDWASLTHVAITHYHADHVGDLAPLLFALRNGLRPRRTEPLDVIGPPGFRGFMERLAAAMGSYVLNPGFPLDVVEVAPDVPYEDPVRGLRIEACPTPHTDESVAYRVGLNDEVVGYTGDTGPSEAVASFLEGCGLLLSECAWSDPCEGSGHLSPERVSALAERARPGLLVLTHVYAPQTPDQAASRTRALYGGRVIAARDGMVLAPESGAWAVDPEPRAV